HRTLRSRPLAAALALAGGAETLQAQPAAPPSENPATIGTVLREDGTPLRVALRAWHEEALRNATPPPVTTTTRPATHCTDDGPGSLRAVIAGSASGDTVDLSALTCSEISLETGSISVRVDTPHLAGPASRRPS